MAKLSMKELSLNEWNSILASNDIDIVYCGLQRFLQYMDEMKNLKIDEQRQCLCYRYIESSPGVDGLFRLWTHQVLHKITRWESVLLDVFARLLQWCKMVSFIKATGEAMIHRILKEHMKTLYRNLDHSNISVLLSTLRLLVFMSNFSILSTKEMFRVFIFDMKRLKKLADDKRQIKHHPQTLSIWHMNVRQLYVRFVLSYVHHADPMLKQQVLETKDFIKSIMKKFPEDDDDTVNYVLDRFKYDILDDFRLSKTVKVRLFSATTLRQILQLYVRNQPREGEKRYIADRAHNFLMEISTVRGKGVCFADTGWYPRYEHDMSHRYYNKVLSEFIHMIRAYEDLKQQTLLLSILKNCPELVVCYWDGYTFPMDIKLSIKWCAMITLMTKIVALEPPPFRPRQVPPHSIVMANILPPMMQRSILSHALQSKNLFIQWTMIIFLMTVLNKVKLICKTAMSLKQDKDDIWKPFCRDIVNETNRRLPDLQLVLSSYHNLISSLMTDKKLSTPHLLHLQYLKLIQLWRCVFPSNFQESRYDPAKLMGDNSFCHADENLRRLLMTFSVFHEFRILPNLTCWLEMYHRMMIAAVTTMTMIPQEDVFKATLEKMLVCHITEATGFFGEQQEDEILAWLTAMRKTKASCTFLSNIVLEANRHTLSYLDEYHQQMASYDSTMMTLTDDLPLSPLRYLLSDFDRSQSTKNDSFGKIDSTTEE
jgi:nucleolar pre-ribosomal-associated protein 1